VSVDIRALGAKEAGTAAEVSAQTVVGRTCYIDEWKTMN